MDDGTKLLTEIRDLLKREALLRDDERDAAQVHRLEPSWFVRSCWGIAGLCLLLAAWNLLAALRALELGWGFALPLASQAALLLVGGAAAVWFVRRPEDSRSQ
jgi:hypothetical protein